MLNHLRLSVLFVGCVSVSWTAAAQEVVLKFHHIWPSTAMAPTRVIGPWCEKIAAESKNHVKCQLLPAMSGGGTPAQLVDRVRDGVDDLVVTLPGYTAGRSCARFARLALDPRRDRRRWPGRGRDRRRPGRRKQQQQRRQPHS